MSTGVRTIRIDAVDTLFFRDGKPFTMGAETWADAVFPPPPSVVYGALRNQYFGENPGQLNLANTTGDPTSTLKIHSIALLKEDILLKKDRLFFPLPLDYVADKTKKLTGLLLQRQEPPEMVSSCWPGIISVFAASNDQSVKTESQGFLDGEIFSVYLKSPPSTVSYTTLKQHSTPEPKIGIARNGKTHTVEEGRLYRVDMRRLQAERKFGDPPSSPLSLYVQFSGLPIADQGVFRLGGEGKLAAYQSVDVPLPTAPTIQGERLKLYLATPAIFDQGWLPSWIDSKTLQVGGKYQHLQLTLETALPGKPINIGGFDMKAGRPKIMRRAVPAGSIYVFTCKGDIQQAVTAFHNQCISDISSHEGFGLTFVGGVQ